MYKITEQQARELANAIHMALVGCCNSYATLDDFGDCDKCKTDKKIILGAILSHTQPAPPASHNEIAEHWGNEAVGVVLKHLLANYHKKVDNDETMIEAREAFTPMFLSAITKATAVLQQKYTEAIKGLAESGRLLLAEKAKADKLAEALGHTVGALKQLPEDTFGKDDNGYELPYYQEWSILEQLIDQGETAIAEHQKGGGDGKPI